MEFLPRKPHLVQRTPLQQPPLPYGCHWALVEWSSWFQVITFPRGPCSVDTDALEVRDSGRDGWASIVTCCLEQDCFVSHLRSWQQFAAQQHPQTGKGVKISIQAEQATRRRNVTKPRVWVMVSWSNTQL